MFLKQLLCVLFVSAYPLGAAVVLPPVLQRRGGAHVTVTVTSTTTQTATKNICATGTGSVVLSRRFGTSPGAVIVLPGTTSTVTVVVTTTTTTTICSKPTQTSYNVIQKALVMTKGG
jgi:hypothetical protein